MRTIVLENDFSDFLPDEVRKLVNERMPDAEIWGKFSRDLREKPDESVEKLLSLRTGDTLVMKHVFINWELLEEMVGLLDVLREKEEVINVYMVYSLLQNELIRYINEKHTKWSQEGIESDAVLKRSYNERLLKVLDHHRVFDCSHVGASRPDWEDHQHRVTSQTIEEEIDRMKRECHHTISEKEGDEYVCTFCGKRRKGYGE